MVKSRGKVSTRPGDMQPEGDRSWKPTGWLQNRVQDGQKDKDGSAAIGTGMEVLAMRHAFPHK